MSHPLVLNLARHDRLTVDEERVVEALSWRIHEFASAEDMVREDARPNESCLVLQGFAARYQILASGKRQLSALHVPGDFVDLHSLLLKVMDHGVIALTDCTAAFVPHEELLRLSETHPHLTRLLWLSTVIDAAIHRAWIVAMGRRSAISHVAHLFCEIFLRLEAVGLTDRYSFYFPLNQAQLADMQGRSIVHVNRTLHFLRSKEIMTWRDSVVAIHDWAGLEAIAEFDPTYLSLQIEPR